MSQYEDLIIPEVNKRRPLDEDEKDGYLESDKDFIQNNHDACIWFLKNHKKLVTAYKHKILQQDYDELYDDHEELKEAHEELKEDYENLKEAAMTLLRNIEDVEQDKDEKGNTLRDIQDLKNALNIL